MIFRRIRGRIVPIKKREEQLTKQDVATGATAGFASALFFKRKVITSTAGFATAAQGISTTVKRFGLHDSKWKATKEDVKASLLKTVATGAGYIAGAGILAALNLRKIAKIRGIK